MDTMDLLGSIIAPFLQYWYLLPIVLLLAFFNSPAGKGIWGEFLVNRVLKRRFSNDEYHLIKNVTLPTEGGSTQIDHVLVSAFGVFVIETKNYGGWIFGSEKQATWTQTIYKSKTKFQNPLRQNYKHIKTLASLLDLPNDQLFSLIVFTGSAVFKTEMPNNVVMLSGLSAYIQAKAEPVFDRVTQQKIIDRIESGRLVPSRQTNKRHTEHVKTIVAEKAKQKTCSRCGSPMVLRTTKKGENKGQQFYGCSSFPKCRNIEK